MTELELKVKELELKKRELDLKEKELDTKFKIAIIDLLKTENYMLAFESNYLGSKREDYFKKIFNNISNIK